MSNDSNNIATVQAIAHIGGLSYVSALITERDSAEYLYTQLLLIAKKLRTKHNFGINKEKKLTSGVKTDKK